jgi:hypothetical protein
MTTHAQPLPQPLAIVTTYQLTRISRVYVNLCAQCAAADHGCGELGPVARGPHRGECHGAKHGAPVRCDCGQWSGTQCCYVAPADALVTVEVTPRWATDAIRIQVTPACAQWIAESDPS